MTLSNVLKSSTNNSKQIPPKKIKKNSPVIPTSDDSHINNIEEEFDHQYFTRLLDSIFDTIHIENMCFSPHKIYNFFDQYIDKSEFIKIQDQEYISSSEDEEEMN